MSSTTCPGRGLITSTREPSSTASSTLWVMKTTVRPVEDHNSRICVLEAFPGEGVERAEGLVHQHHVRVVGQHAGDLAALLHPARQLVDGPVGEVGESDAVELGERAGSALGLPDSAQAQPELDVLADRQPRVQRRRVLEHDAAIRPGPGDRPSADVTVPPSAGGNRRRAAAAWSCRSRWGRRSSRTRRRRRRGRSVEGDTSPPVDPYRWRSPSMRRLARRPDASAVDGAAVGSGASSATAAANVGFTAAV